MATISRDQNPIENLWGILVRKIYGNHRQYQNVMDLKRAVIEAVSVTILGIV